MVKVVRLLSLKCLPSSKSHEKSLRMSAGSKRIGLGILVWGILVSPLGSALASSAACVNCHQDQVSLGPTPIMPGRCARRKPLL